MKKIISIFIFIFSISLFSFSLVKYYENLVINFSFENVYTGRIEDKMFLAKNLFSKDYLIIVPNIYNFSEGIFIDKKDDSTYFSVSNTNSFSNKFCIFATIFNKDLIIYRNKIFVTYSDFYIINFFSGYENEKKTYFFIGLLNKTFDINGVLGKFSFDEFKGIDITKSVEFGTNLTDYPFYFSQYESDDFKGYLVLSLIEKNYTRDFNDLKLTFESKRFNSDSILVCFFDSNMDLKKYFALRFPRNIIDFSVVRKSLDSVLLRVDFVDRISGYYIATNFVNISFNDTYITGTSYDVFNQFYLDNFVGVNWNKLQFNSNDVNVTFKYVKLIRR